MPKTVLIFIDWYYPGYLAGGPVQSVLSLTEALSPSFNFKIVTSNADLGQDHPYPDITCNKWQRVMNADVMYLDKAHRSYTFLKNLLRETDFDLLYLNSFFSFSFSILPLVIARRIRLNKKIIIAPRGMLGEGALQIKPFKKRMFLMACNTFGFHKNLTWHATSVQEETEIKRRIRSAVKINVIDNLPKKISVKSHIGKNRGHLNLFFFSRISRKKQLHYALEVLGKVKEGKIHFSIFGPIEDDGYWQECNNQIKTLPPHITTEYRGALQPGQIAAAFSGEHAMILPTLNENFGHSIVEALLCGCPVVISDNTPWNDVEKNNAGFAIPLNKPEAFIQAINFYLQMGENEFISCRSDCIKYIGKKIDLASTIERYKNLFYGVAKN